jgi:hypothetical protein
MTATSTSAYESFLRNLTFWMLVQLDRHLQRQDLPMPKVGLQNRVSYAWWVVSARRGRALRGENVKSSLQCDG